MSNAILPLIINISFRIKVYYYDSSKDTSFEILPTHSAYIFPFKFRINNPQNKPWVLCQEKCLYLCEYKEKRQSACFHGSLVPYKYFSL